MNLFDTILKPFRKKELTETQSEEIAILPLEETNKETLHFVQETPQNTPNWVSDENQLRDEGVLYGLSDANPDEKIVIIRSHFTQQTADLEKQKQHLDNKIKEINLFIEEKEKSIGELKNKINITEEKQANTDTQLLRTSIGLLLSLGMCLSNYFLIQEVFVSSFANSQPVAIGLFLSGLFNLFGKTSLFHEPSSSSWQKILEEVGMPLAASFFVFVVALQNRPTLMAFAIFVFVFFLFLFAGKLFLSNLTLLRNDWVIIAANKQLKHDKKHQVEDWKKEIEKLQTSLDTLRADKWQILPDLNKTEASLNRLNAQCSMLINLFESEYNLAKNYRLSISSQ